MATFALRVLGAAAASIFVAACSSASSGGEGTSGTSEDELTRSIPPNHLVDDAMVRTSGRVTGDAVQAVLAEAGGPLASYREGGLRAADIIANECATYGIAPGYLLARIQGESSLVYGGSIRNVAHATGCGCPDGERCSPAEAGFTSQVKCAAELMSQYFTQIERTGRTVADWGPGVRQKTLDGCTVVPVNASTAALYTYTPWVGADGIGCGSASHGGSTEIAELTVSFTRLLPAPVAPPPPSPPASDAGTPSSADAGQMNDAGEAPDAGGAETMDDGGDAGDDDASM